MYKFSRLRQWRSNSQHTKLLSLRGVAVVVLMLSLTVGGTLAAVDGSYIQAITLFTLLGVVVAFFRVTTKDESYDRYLQATEVLKEMSGLVVDLEKEGIPIEGKHGEDFYKFFTAAQNRAGKRTRLTREDMDFVTVNTALAHTALENHAAVESVEGD